MNHNIEERSKYAEDFLLKVRLHLLSRDTIKHILNDSTFAKNNGCVKTLKKMLNCREEKINKSSITYHSSRYCNQKYFKLLDLGGFNLTTLINYSNVRSIDVNKVGDVEAYPEIKTGCDDHKTISLKGYIFIFGGWNNNGLWINSVDRYSLTSKIWNQVAKINDDREWFCVCAFIDEIFVIGGRKDGVRTNGCLKFDTSD